jgi:hypothetical protein
MQQGSVVRERRKLGLVLSMVGIRARRRQSPPPNRLGDRRVTSRPIIRMTGKSMTVAKLADRQSTR